MSNILGNLLENLLTFCYAFSFIFGHMLLLPNCTCHAENACQRNTGLLFFFFLFYKVLFGKAKVMTNTHNRSFFFNQVISSVQSLSPVQLFEIPWTAACQASLSITNSHRVGDAIQPSHLLSSSSSAAFNLSQHQGLFK